MKNQSQFLLKTWISLDSPTNNNPLIIQSKFSSINSSPKAQKQWRQVSKFIWIV